LALGLGRLLVLGMYSGCLRRPSENRLLILI
jgi:hypothetical protein